MRRRRTTSLNSMEPILSFEQMWRDLAPVGRSSSSGGYFRQPFESAETELRAWFVEQATARGLRSSPTTSATSWPGGTRPSR